MSFDKEIPKAKKEKEYTIMKRITEISEELGLTGEEVKKPWNWNWTKCIKTKFKVPLWDPRGNGLNKEKNALNISLL